MLVPVPKSVGMIIANRATQLAREDLQRRGWKSAMSISPIASDGSIGLKVTAKYLMFQDRGTKPFIMKWVEGRRVPIKGAGGSVRIVTGRGAGLPGWVFIPGRGRVWRDQKWRHPGLKPQYFLEKAINQAIAENRIHLQQMVMNVLMGKPPQ